MRKIFALFSYLFILSGLLAWPWPSAVNQEAVSTPTAPPPPMATRTLPPPTKTHLPPERPTDTPTHIPGKGGENKTSIPTHTPTSIAAFSSTPTSTLTSTATLTPTLTPTITPTPFLNLHVVVYLDANQDNLFEQGEGVNDLLLLVNVGAWKEEVILQNGEVWLALPPDLSSSSDVQVQSPYLHWSDVLHTPKPGEILDVNLRLDSPQFPVSLP